MSLRERIQIDDDNVITIVRLRQDLIRRIDALPTYVDATDLLPDDLVPIASTLFRSTIGLQHGPVLVNAYLDTLHGLAECKSFKILETVAGDFQIIVDPTGALATQACIHKNCLEEITLSEEEVNNYGFTRKN